MTLQLTNNTIRSTLFQDITQCTVEFHTDILGQPIIPIF